MEHERRNRKRCLRVLKTDIKFVYFCTRERLKKKKNTRIAWVVRKHTTIMKVVVFIVTSSSQRHHPLYRTWSPECCNVKNFHVTNSEKFCISVWICLSSSTSISISHPNWSKYGIEIFHIVCMCLTTRTKKNDLGAQEEWWYGKFLGEEGERK